MYGGRMMSDSSLAINATSLPNVAWEAPDPQILWNLQDQMTGNGVIETGYEYPSKETQFVGDYEAIDFEDALFFNGTNGTNFTSFIPEGLKYINRTQLIAYSLLFPFAAIGNLVVFVALFRNRHRKSRVNMMIMHLSLADMIVTFVFLPTEITWHITIEWVFGNVGCKIYKFLSAFGFYMSSMVLVCISLDRYFAVLHPLKVNDAQRRGKIMLFFAWLISSVISLPQTVIFNVQLHPTIPDFYQCVTFGFFDSNNGGEMMYTIFCISFLYFIPLTIIIIAYTRIILEITRKSRDTQQDNSREERYHGRLHLRRSNMSNIERARTRTLRMTFIIVMAFIWCWTPYALGTLWNFIDPETFHSMNQQVQDILFIIAVSNSVVNPIIYGRYSISCCRGLWYKAGEICCCCCCCCCSWTSHKRMQVNLPPNAISCKSNGHFNAQSANTRSTIYNHSAREKMVVGVRLQVKVRTLLMEWNRASQRQQRHSCSEKEADMASMIPLGVMPHCNLPTTGIANGPEMARNQDFHQTTRFFQRDYPAQAILQEKDDSSGYSSSHAHSFRSYHDVSTSDKVLKAHIWENHHSC